MIDSGDINIFLSLEAYLLHWHFIGVALTTGSFLEVYKLLQSKCSAILEG